MYKDKVWLNFFQKTFNTNKNHFKKFKPIMTFLASWCNKYSSLAWSPLDHETLSKVY